MANKKLWFGIMVTVLVFGMAVAGCSEDGSVTVSLDGTWISVETFNGTDYFKFVASGGSFKEYMASSKTATTWTEIFRGTCPDGPNPITTTITELDYGVLNNAPSSWKSWASISDAEKTAVGIEQSFKITVSGNKFAIDGFVFEKQ